MLGAAGLADQFLRHVRNCSSGRVSCGFEAAFESWFRVELAMMWVVLYKLDLLEFDYRYPGSAKKADLLAEIGENQIVFELKCFVCDADRNKLQKWPAQIERLSHLVRDGQAKQCVAVSTFFRYSKERLCSLLGKFHPSPWKVAGPDRFFEDLPLQIVIATVNAEQAGIAA